MQATENPLLLKLESTMLSLAPKFWNARTGPGAHPAELRSWEQWLQVEFPPLVREFLLWRSFSDSGGHHEFSWPGTWNLWGYLGPDFRATVAHHEFLCEMYGADLETPDGFDPDLEGEVPLQPGRWNVKWVPLFVASQGTGCLCLDMAGLFGGKVGQLVEFDDRSPNRQVTFASLEEYLEILIASVEEGLWEPESETDAEPRDREQLCEFFESRATSPLGSVRVERSQEPVGAEGEFRRASLNEFEFTAREGYNGVDPPVGERVSVWGSFGPQATGGEFLRVDIQETQGDLSRTLHLSITDQRGLRAGYKYQVGPLQDSLRSFVTLYERTPSGETQRWQVSGETQGFALITSMDDQQIELTFQFFKVERRPEKDMGNAEGSFDVSGELLLTL